MNRSKHRFANEIGGRITAVNASASQASLQLPGLHGLAWVIWRQHRVVLAGAVVLLGWFGLFMLVNGQHLKTAQAPLDRPGY